MVGGGVRGRYPGSNFMMISYEKLGDKPALEKWIMKKYEKVLIFKDVVQRREENFEWPEAGLGKEGIDSFGDSRISLREDVVGEDIFAIRTEKWFGSISAYNRYVKNRYKDKIIRIYNTVVSRSEGTSLFNQMLSIFQFLR